MSGFSLIAKRARFLRLSRVVLALAAMMFTASTAQAQSDLGPNLITPPVFTAIDHNHVDLLSGSLMQPTTPVSVGIDGAGLSEKMTWNSGLFTSNNVLFENLGYIRYSSSFTNQYGEQYGPTSDGYSVTIGGSTTNFFLESGVFVPQIPNGSTLTLSGGVYTFTMKDGTVATFSTALASTYFQTILGAGITAYITQIKKPDGEIKTYTYSLININNNSSHFMTNLDSVSSNYGYQLNYYGWQSSNFGVTATNTAAIYCSPTASTCSGGGATWPVGNFASTGVVSTNDTVSTAFSDTLNNVTTLNLGPITGYTGGPVVVTGTIRPNDAAVGSDVSVGFAYLGFGPMGSSSPVVNTITNAAGTWTYAWSGPGTINVKVTDPLGHQRVITSTVNLNQITSDTDANGNTTQYAYDSNYHLTSVTHPSGIVDQYTYDSRGNITSHTKVAVPGSGLANIVESAVFPTSCSNPVTCNKPTATIDANNNETDYTYDPISGLLLTKTLPAAVSGGIRPTTTYVYQQLSAVYYNASGQLAPGAPIWKLSYTSTCQTLASCVGTSDEVRVTYTYDGNLRPVTITTAAGDGSLSRTVTNTYDAVGNLTSVTEPKGSANTPTTTVYIYDAGRRKIGEIGPAPTGNGHYRATRTTYDKDGNVVLTEQGWTTSQSDTTLSSFTSLEQHAETYDSIDRKVQETASGGGTTYALTQYGYDAASRLQCTTVRMNAALFGSPPSSACTLGTQGADGPDRITYNSYDAAGRLLQVTSGYGTPLARNDKTLTYTVDGLQQTAADGKGNLTTWVYDGFDRISQIFYPNPTNGSVSSTTDYEQYGYDAASNVLTDRRRDGQTLTMAYDALNREVSKAVPNLATIYSTYDLLGRKLSLTYNSTTGPGSVYTYDALGRVKSASSYGWGLTFQYDLAGEQTQITWWDGLQIHYAYDVDGEMTSITPQGANSNGATLATYAYDDLGARTTLTRGNGVVTTYGHDGVSRLISLAHTMSGGNIQNQTYGLAYTASNQIKTLTQTNAAYLYQTLSANRTYTVNGLNQLTTSSTLPVTYDLNGNLSSDSVTNFTYDVLNRLQSTSVGGVAAASATYDPEDRLVSLSLNGTTTQFGYIGPDVATEYNVANGQIFRRYIPGPAEDETEVWYEGSDASHPRWLLEDHLGSVVAVTDTTGGALAINTYDDYGAPGVGNLGRYQYTGQMWLPEVGLYDYKARLYSPTLGRFMQTDPVGYKDGMNWYDYVHDDPINGSDPSGTACRGMPHCREIQFGDSWDFDGSEDQKSTQQTNSTPQADAKKGIVGQAVAAVQQDIKDHPILTTLNLIAGLATNWEDGELGAAPEAVGLEAIELKGASAVEGGLAKGLKSLCCFVSGTLVSTKTGLQPIEQIGVGDLVLSRDAATGQTAFKPVIALIHRHHREIYAVKFDIRLPNGAHRMASFETTDDHPWRAADGRWLTTLELKAGSEILTAYGPAAHVVEVVKTGRTAPTFNLDVADFHTYFVGEDRVWVHNACDPTELHHITPKYLGGANNGPVAAIPRSLHRLITNAFRRLAPYGKGPRSPEEVEEIMRKVYEQHPLP